MVVGTLKMVGPDLHMEPLLEVQSLLFGHLGITTTQKTDKVTEKKKKKKTEVLGSACNKYYCTIKHKHGNGNQRFSTKWLETSFYLNQEAERIWMTTLKKYLH